jgi:serine/threonine-protein kinase
MTEAWKQWEGQVVNGKFHLGPYLGGSDHSAVFLTELSERGLQKAAIKLIAADPKNAEVCLSRLMLAARLSHPHLIQLFQMGPCQLGTTELLYVVMEYADENLSQILPHRAVTAAEARDILMPVLEALAYLHGKGFVHGHIKPANIMAIDDRIRVSSDGLCPMDESSGGLWKPGLYDPPEAASKTNSAASDIWALGLTLAEALTQRIPVWQSTEQGEPVVPETLPAPFFDLVRHCLRRNPQHRWALADIAMLLQPASPILQKQTTATPTTAFVRRRYALPTVAVSLALALLLAGPRLLNRRAKTQPRPEQPLGKTETEQSTRRSADEMQSSGGTAQSPTSLQSEGGAKRPTGGPVQGEILHQVLPDVPESARDTIRGKVRVSVRVAVDPSGNIVGATLDSSGPSRYFANLALQAARRWEFGAAKVDNRSVPSQWILRFEFERTATKVFPVRATP